MSVELDPRPKLLFIHIPKTGGTALYHALKQAYGPENTTRLGGEDSDGLRRSCNRYHVVATHAPYPTLMDYGFSEYLPISVIRDPVKRAISVYNFARSLPRHPLHSEFCMMSPEDWVRRIEADQARCRQIWHLTGASNLDDAEEVLSKYLLIIMQEDLDDGARILSEAAGVQLRLFRLNVTNRRESAVFNPDQRVRLAQALAEEYRLVAFVKTRWLTTR